MGLFPGRDRPPGAHAGRHVLGGRPGPVRRGLPAGAARDPDELLAKMPIHDVRFLGGILLAIALSYLVLCFTIRKPVHVFGKEFVFPVPRIAVAQMVVAGVDLIAAAACMYVLLPGDLGIGFIDFCPAISWRRWPWC